MKTKLLLIQGFFLICILFWTQTAKYVWALIGDSEGAFGLDGSLRIIGAVSGNYDFPALFEDDDDEYLQTILRLTAGGRPYDRCVYEIHALSTLTYFTRGGASAGAGFGDPGTRTRYRAYDKS